MSSFKASAIKPRKAGAVMRSAIALGFSLAVSTFSSHASAACSYTVVNQWGNGFQAAIKITNTNSTAINGWDVTWRYNGDNRVNSSWNVVFSGQNPYTAKNVSWNGTIQPNQTVEFGFVGTKGSAAAEIPAVTGAACGGVVASSSVPKSSVVSSSVVSSSLVSSSKVPSSSAVSSSVATSSSLPPVSSSSVSSSMVSEMCSGNNLFCLDFENVAPGATPAGFTKEGNGIAVVDGQESHSGRRSVKFRSTNSGDYGYFKMNAVQAKHWGRLYYKMKTPVPNIGTWMHGTFVTSRGNNGEFRFVDTVQDASGKHQYLYNSEPGDVSLQGAYAYSFDNSWVCTEWYVDSQTQTYRFFRNGTEVFFTKNGQVSDKTNWPGFTTIPTTLDYLGFGFRVYQQTNGVEGWLDDVAVSTQRIGCGGTVASSSAPSSVISSVSSSVAVSSSVPSSTPSSTPVSSSVVSSSSVSSIIVVPSSMSSSSVALDGAALYTSKNCAVCHGARGDSTTRPIVVANWTRATLITKIATTMPANNPGTCTGDCAAAIADYILSWKPVVSSSSSVKSSVVSSSVVSSSVVSSSSVSSIVSSSAVSSSKPALDGAALYESKTCSVCHGARGDNPTRPIVVASWTRSTLITKISTTMPANNPGTCTGDCAAAIADYILSWRPPVTCNADEDVLPRRLRLLTNYEYANTVNDLLNVTTGASISARFEADAKVTVFNNDVDATRLNNSRMDAYWSAAETLAASASMTNLMTCATNISRDQCASTFVPTFGKKAFRRPLSSDEQTSYSNLFRLGASNEAGARLVIQSMLSSPNFLYRTELGSSVSGPTTLTPYETASLLSYTFTASMPDATLITEADNNRLTTPAQLRTQAERLLATPKASVQVDRFGSQWLKVDDVANLQRDPALFPSFSPAIGAAMTSEMNAFLSEIFIKPGYKMADVFNPGFTFVNGPLAAYYGMSGVTGDQFQKVPTNAQRGGVLHLGAVSASLAKVQESHPIRRGLMVRRNLLCQEFGQPPAVIGEVEPLNPNKPTRERFAAHTTNPNCQQCHQYIDKIGFGFENYDAVGHFRTTEGNAIPIDATGEISGLKIMTDSDHYAFNDLRGLSTVLATSGAEATSKCLVRQYQRFATGVAEPNECLVNSSYSRWQAKSTDLREMMLETLTSPTYLTRK